MAPLHTTSAFAPEPLSFDEKALVALVENGEFAEEMIAVFDVNFSPAPQFQSHSSEPDRAEIDSQNESEPAQVSIIQLLDAIDHADDIPAENAGYLDSPVTDFLRFDPDVEQVIAEILAKHPHVSREEVIAELEAFGRI